MTRDELIAHAQRIGVKRPEVMTRAELADEILRLGETDALRRQRARGWFGVARDLLASVVEQGLHLPDAAKAIRGGTVFQPRVQAPIATVTLAEIYAAQGHPERALGLLDQVLAKEPDHDPARRLRDSLSLQGVAPSTSTDELAERLGPEASTSSPPPESERTPAPPWSSSALPEDREMPQVAPTAGGIAGEFAPEAELADVSAVPVESELDPSRPITAADQGGDWPEQAMVSDTQPPPPPGAESAETRQASDAAAVQFEDVMVGVHGPVAGDTLPPPATGSETGLDPTEDSACLLLGTDRSHCLCWELSRITRERAERLDPSGEPVVKVLFFAPDPRGTQRTERHVPITAPTGTVQIESPSIRAVLCAALGWQSTRGFQPFMLAAQFTPTGELLRWPLGRRTKEQARDARARALGRCRPTPRPGWSVRQAAPAELEGSP